MKKIGFLSAFLLLASCAQVPSRDQFASEQATDDADATMGDADAGTDAALDAPDAPDADVADAQDSVDAAAEVTDAGGDDADADSQDAGKDSGTDAADTVDAADALPDSMDADVAVADVDAVADADVAVMDAVDVQDAAVAEVDVVAGTDVATNDGDAGDASSDTADAAADVDDTAGDVTAVACTVAACDDGNICTTDSCDANNACLHTANAVPCPDDGVTCTSDTCSGGTCAHTVVPGTCFIGSVCWSDGAVDAATPCLACLPSQSAESWSVGGGSCFIDGSCVATGVTQAGGCQICLPKSATASWSEVTGACDDGNPCTPNDTCAAGACVSGSNVCACNQTSDCAAKEDGNLCNGTLYCDTSAVPYNCKVDPKTVVVCDKSADGQCKVTSCAPTTGQCSTSPLSDGKSCDADGSICTVSDSCQAGVCTVGSKLGCADSNPCTDDSCDAQNGCVHTANTAACDADGNACTVGDACSGKVCATGSAKTCNDGNACTVDSCDPSTGNCVFNGAPYENSVCSDNNLCTNGDSCKGGVCTAGPALSCPSSNPCLDASCDALIGCKATYNTASCDDGLKCTTGDVCQNGTCSGASKVCNDGQTCTDDSCSAATGLCVYNGSAHEGAACDDNNVCTLSAGDLCQSGVCVGTSPKSCDDGKPCTADSCDPVSGCVYGNAANNTACNDGSACTSPDVCTSGVCGGAAISCVDAYPCTTDSCNSSTGCVHTAVNSACDDGIACTTDACSAATGCSHTAVNSACDDSTTCTTDACSVSTGCSHVDNGTTCNDGNVCTNDVCTSGNGTTGCSHSNATNGTACNDGSACTSSDVCTSGACGGTAISCADAFPCTTDSCNTSTGCSHVAVNSACDDSTTCTTDSCSVSTGCVHVSDGTTCNDGNVCTNDVCTSGNGTTGCTHSNVGAGTTCDDANACTTGDVCSAGVCAGTGPVCGDGVCGCTESFANCPGDCPSSTPAGMVLIPAGTFWMGCNSTKDTSCSGYSQESPQHKVTLSAYYMDLTETTVGQYKACVDAGVCTVPSTQSPSTYATYPGFPSNPVNYVNWTQSQQYCQWRGAGFDLPTEAQWEMAAKGNCEKNGSTAGDAGCAAAMRTYPWGEPTATCSYAVMYDGANSGCGTNATWAVGSKTAGDSPYGLHDMAGNVYEWTRDWYSSTYYGSSPATDPYDSASASARVYRGGGFSTTAVGLRAGYRSGDTPSYAFFSIGLRCMRSYP